VAQYDWEHGIAPRKKDVWHGLRVDRRRRLSVTFRFLAAGDARVPSAAARAADGPAA
jgi:hypothetical protein